MFLRTLDEFLTSFPLICLTEDVVGRELVQTGRLQHAGEAAYVELDLTVWFGANFILASVRVCGCLC